MKMKQQAFALLAGLMAIHLSVLTFASVGCIRIVFNDTAPPRQACERLGNRWQATVETYLAVILALLVPTFDRPPE